MDQIHQYVARTAIGELIGSSFMETFLFSNRNELKIKVQTFLLPDNRLSLAEAVVLFMTRKRPAPDSQWIVIFYGDGVTHFRCALKLRKTPVEFYDPYTSHQAPGTNGYCQTFALMQALKWAKHPYMNNDEFDLTEVAIPERRLTTVQQRLYTENAFRAHRFAILILGENHAIGEGNWQPTFKKLSPLMSYRYFWDLCDSITPVQFSKILDLTD